MPLLSSLPLTLRCDECDLEVQWDGGEVLPPDWLIIASRTEHLVVCCWRHLIAQARYKVYDEDSANWKEAGVRAVSTKPGEVPNTLEIISPGDPNTLEIIPRGDPLPPIVIVRFEGYVGVINPEETDNG